LYSGHATTKWPTGRSFFPSLLGDGPNQLPLLGWTPRRSSQVSDETEVFLPPSTPVFPLPPFSEIPFLEAWPVGSWCPSWLSPFSYRTHFGILVSLSQWHPTPASVFVVSETPPLLPCELQVGSYGYFQFLLDSGLPGKPRTASLLSITTSGGSSFSRSLMKRRRLFITPECLLLYRCLFLS